MKDRFIAALQQNSLHNHITRGGNKRYIEDWCGVKIPECPKFADLHEMNQWNAIHLSLC